MPSISSDDINVWLKAADLHGFPATLEVYTDSMNDAGFVEISGRDANQWYLKKAEQELAQLIGPLFEKAAEVCSEALRDMVVNEWQAMNVVLKSGELKSGYFRGRKPT